MGARSSNTFHQSNYGFITQDRAMLNLLQMTAKIAPSDITVLIQGESGTGKELIAKQIHGLSHRVNHALVSINCGAIQDNLLLSELFGHEKGAFTGAVCQKKGLVEVADGGTLFLDEIGEMGIEAQTKVLRFLQEGEIYRVGGKDPIRVHTRIISATNKDLEAEVQKKRFREDLFYRINTVTLRILPLRKRANDIPLLINEFLETGNSTEVRSITDEAMDILKQYNWPGNVRELQNTIERFKILVDAATVTVDDVPLNIQNVARETELAEESATFLLSQVEKRHILRVLEHFQGNKTRAANAMGITVKTLYNKLERYGQPAVQPTHH